MHLSDALPPCVNTDTNHNVTVTTSTSFTTMPTDTLTNTPTTTTTTNQHPSSPAISDEDRSTAPPPNIFIVEREGSRRGAKFHISGRVGGVATPFIIDTGAEVSLLPRKLIRNSLVSPLPEEIKVFGFQSCGEPSIIKETADVHLALFPSTLAVQFLICETNDDVAVIGADILRDQKLKIGFHTSSETLTIGDDVFRTKTSPRASTKELVRREKLGEEEYRREMSIAAGKTSWMRTTRRITLPPRTMWKVECFVDGARAPIGAHVLLSLWDEGGDDIAIPSITMDRHYGRYFLPMNQSLFVEDSSWEK